MKILNFQERIDFVDSVVHMCNVVTDENSHGEYHPAIFDVAFRVCVLKYFYDVDIDSLETDILCNRAYIDFDESILLTEQIASLRNACVERIDRSHKEFLTVMLMNKRDSFDKLIQNVEIFLNDMSSKFGNVNVVDLLEAIKRFESIDKDRLAVELAKKN